MRTSDYTGLMDCIANGSAVFGVVGLGYVGLPLVVEMARSGHRVIGFDNSSEKVTQVNAGRSYIPDVDSSAVADLVSGQLLSATSDFSRAAECDCIAICVPTPLDSMKEPDTSFMRAATEAIAPHLRRGVLVTLESTTYPGTTEELVKPILEASGLEVGRTVFLAFSPERIDPGNPVYNTKNTPKIVGGTTDLCANVAVAFYERFLDQVIRVSSTRAAEMTKLLENIFRCVNIALVNELLMLCDRMDVDMWEVVDAARTKPFGFMPFYPGPGLGGHCIPIDPFYLAWKARDYDFHTEFIELAGKVNENMPYYVISKLMDALNTHEKTLNCSTILLLGVAYKSDIDDTRESPAFKIAHLLRQKGANVRYYDPYVPEFVVDGVGVPRAELTAEELAAADACVVVTGHSQVDYDLIADHASLIFDTRNVFGGRSDSAHVHRL